MNTQQHATMHQSVSGVELEGYIILPKGYDWKDVQETLGQAVNKLQLAVPDDPRFRPRVYADYTQRPLRIWVKECGGTLEQEVKERLYKVPVCVRADIWMRNESPTMNECRVGHAGTLSVQERLNRHAV